MPTANLASEILSIAGSSIPDGPSQGVIRLAGVVGDSPNFTLAQTFAAQTTTLTRVPAGSSATVSSNAWTADKPGLYRTTVSAGGFSRTIEHVMFPASVLTLKVNPSNPNSATVSRQHLQGAANDNSSQANITASLEATPSTLVGVTGLAGAPAWMNYGNC
jgi:hypothetical protein